MLTLWHLATDITQMGKRYQQAGGIGLESLSRRPHRIPNRKVTQANQENISRMRKEKVELSQLTDKVAFWSRYSHKEQEIDQRIQKW